MRVFVYMSEIIVLWCTFDEALDKIGISIALVIKNFRVQGILVNHVRE